MRTKKSLIPETDTDLAGGLDQLMIRIDEFQTINSVSDWRILNFIILVTHHAAKLALGHQLNRLEAELRAQKSVECRRSSASLKMAQDATPAFLGGSPGHLRCYDLSDAAEPMLAIGVMMVGLFAVLRLR